MGISIATYDLAIVTHLLVMEQEELFLIKNPFHPFLAEFISTEHMNNII